MKTGRNERSFQQSEETNTGNAHTVNKTSKSVNTGGKRLPDERADKSESSTGEDNNQGYESLAAIESNSSRENNLVIFVMKTGGDYADQNACHSSHVECFNTENGRNLHDWEVHDTCIDDKWTCHKERIVTDEAGERSDFLFLFCQAHRDGNRKQNRKKSEDNTWNLVQNQNDKSDESLTEERRCSDNLCLHQGRGKTKNDTAGSQRCNRHHQTSSQGWEEIHYFVFLHVLSRIISAQATCLCLLQSWRPESHALSLRHWSDGWVWMLRVLSGMNAHSRHPPAAFHWKPAEQADQGRTAECCRQPFFSDRWCLVHRQVLPWRHPAYWRLRLHF